MECKGTIYVCNKWIIILKSLFLENLRHLRFPSCVVWLAGTAHNSEGSQFRRSSSPKVLNSEGPQFRRFSSPKVLKSENKYVNYMCVLLPCFNIMRHWPLSYMCIRVEKLDGEV